MKSLKISFLLLFLFVSCNKDPIPYAVVNFNENLNSPRLNSLNNAGNSVIIEHEGVSGLIISRTWDNSYVAFDRCSTVNPEKKCAVVPDPSGDTATDPCSGAMFSLLDGSARKAPASRPLKQYRVYVNESSITIVN